MKETDISTLKELKEQIEGINLDELSLIYENWKEEVDYWEEEILSGNVSKGTYEYRQIRERIREFERMMMYITKWPGQRKK